MSQDIELVEVVQQLRRELGRALERAADEDIRFELGSVELELSITVEKSGNMGGKVRFMVVDADLGGKRSSVASQRLKLVLNPWQVSDGSGRVSIAGETVANER